MKPLGTNNAAENELTTPKSTFGKPISQCGLSTKSLKPSELTKPEKTSLQRVNRLLYQTNSQSRVSAKKFDSVTQKVTAPKNRSTAETMPILVFYHAD
ncbi:hypothetical protein [Vibrio parahaemolyticus]|uniref:hypothetical protein n=1 Tax=Vibrio parahaemolyticus TaxID=670 RepID=UPI000A82421F|nr:hypothetical protein [Vibrio parahaemolyticus]EJG1289916.1 hypothetical protein [Vibrio parahaemolyticus]EJG1299793.1 hypothetical protein [Vibrio parahaemolyticus]EJG1332353.1 hypothetical protein [Vibrio parahaemolyticus]ELJ8798340.1 hypothetical protein [Vibrio parahaemolyticus]MBM5400915.1 hypothetical protein [Vibrio parahaemolyticus]